MDVKKAIEQSEIYPEVDTIIQKVMANTKEGYKYLYSLKGTIPKELYAFYLRKIWNMKTEGLPVDLALKMFDGVKPEDIMYDEELEAIKHFDDYVTIYRGASLAEKSPRLSWTLRRSVAVNNSDFANGRLFIATIPKQDIMLYLAKDSDEEEVVVHVTEGFEIVDDLPTRR